MAQQKARARAAAKGDAWGSFNDVWTKLADQFRPPSSSATTRRASRAPASSQSSSTASARPRPRTFRASRSCSTAPVYAEMGGQAGDRGLIDTDSAQLFVRTPCSRAVYVHEGNLSGSLSEGDVVFAASGHQPPRPAPAATTPRPTCSTPPSRRSWATMNQAGSLVAHDYLRFDFTHFEAMTTEQIQAVEDLVNARGGRCQARRHAHHGHRRGQGLRRRRPVRWRSTATSFASFPVGEEDQPFSRELCGGTHASNTSELGLLQDHLRVLHRIEHPPYRGCRRARAPLNGSRAAPPSPRRRPPRSSAASRRCPRASPGSVPTCASPTKTPRRPLRVAGCRCHQLRDRGRHRHQQLQAGLAQLSGLRAAAPRILGPIRREGRGACGLRRRNGDRGRARPPCSPPAPTMRSPAASRPAT